MWFLLLGCMPDAAVGQAPAPTSTAVVAAPVGMTLESAFPTPAGLERVAVAPESFGAYLRQLPLYAPDRQVQDYQGNVMAMPAVRVVNMPVGNQDLQQCADSILRLRATWERSQGHAPAFHYTSGDLSAWAAWAAGTRLKVSGNTVKKVAHAAAPDASDQSFDAWLMDLFMYAGTRSLGLDTVAGNFPPQPGDLLVTPGSPGHAVLILDVARSATEMRVLVGQGFMPAMDFHVVENLEGGAWFAVAGATLPVSGEKFSLLGVSLPTRPIAMDWSGLRRFPDIQ